MAKKIDFFHAFRYIGLLVIVLAGLFAIIGTGGGDSQGDYLVGGTIIYEPPPPATASDSAPDIFDLSVDTTGGASITFTVSFTDLEGDVTTFGIAFDDKPRKYYAYAVEDETFGQTSYSLTVKDTIAITVPGTYCFTVFVQDKEGNTSNKLRGCFTVKCDKCYEDCTSNCDNGSMVISGVLDGKSISLSGTACAKKNDEIVMGIFCNSFYYIGIRIKAPGKLASGKTFTVKPQAGDEITSEDFPVVVEYFNPEHWEQSASGGTFTVVKFNDNTLVATYDLIMPDGGEIYGNINIWGFKDFDPER